MEHAKSILRVASGRCIQSPRGRSVGIILLVSTVLVVVVLSGPTAIAAEPAQNGTPNVVLTLPDNQLDTASSDVIEVQIENDAHPANRTHPEDILVARSVSINATDTGPLDVATESRSVGTLGPGDITTATFAVTVPGDVEPGEYDIEIQIQHKNVTTKEENITVQHTSTKNVTVEVIERPRFAITAVDTTAQVGTDGTVSVELENVGAEAARDVTLTLESPSNQVAFGSTEVRSPADSRQVTNISPGETTVLTYDIDVASGASAESYTLEGAVRYTDEDGLSGMEDGVDTAVVPLDAQTFELSVLESAAQIGETGEVTVEVANTGELDASNIRVELLAQSHRTGFGHPEEPVPQDSARIDTLQAGETAIVTYDVVIGTDATPREYGFDGQVRFDGPADNRGLEDGHAIGIVPHEEQSFSVDTDESTLRAGETGDVTATITNDGPLPVKGVGLTVGESAFDPRSPSQSIGELDAGEARTVTLRGNIPREATAVTQRIPFAIEYTTETGTDRVTTKSLEANVAERRDALDIDAGTPTFAAGEDGTLDINVTNELDTEVRDVRLGLTVEDPLDSDFRTTGIPALGPDDPTAVTFDLEVDSGAPPSQFPATIEIEYVDRDDEIVNQRPVMIGITVVDVDDEAPIEIVVFVALLALLAAVLVWLYRR